MDSLRKVNLGIPAFVWRWVILLNNLRKVYEGIPAIVCPEVGHSFEQPSQGLSPPSVSLRSQGAKADTGDK